MTPSINELFSAPGSEAEDDFELDMDKLMEGVDASLRESTRFSTGGDEVDAPSAVEEPGEPSSSPSEDPGHEEPAADEPPAEPSGGEREEPPGEPAAPPAADPLGLLFAEAAQDPAKRDRLLAALREPKAEIEPAAATLPEDIEEGTVAARLWHDNQRTRAELTKIADGQRAQSEAYARQQATSAAEAAGNEFAQRYSGKLDGDDVVRIAQAAGNSGLAARLAAGTEDLKGAYLQALESTLWTEPSLRQKVLESAAPVEPTLAQEHAAESKPRKRKLTALSSAASPTSAPSERRSPLETRTDGKLTPQSRLSVVGELASKLAKERTEGMY